MWTWQFQLRIIVADVTDHYHRAICSGGASKYCDASVYGITDCTKDAECPDGLTGADADKLPWCSSMFSVIDTLCSGWTGRWPIPRYVLCSWHAAQLLQPAWAEQSDDCVFYHTGLEQIVQARDVDKICADTNCIRLGIDSSLRSAVLLPVMAGLFALVSTVFWAVGQQQTRTVRLRQRRVEYMVNVICTNSKCFAEFWSFRWRIESILFILPTGVGQKFNV